MQSRTNKSILNILTSMIGQILGLVISFVARIFFIKTLGKAYLGINGLFSNILSFLSLAELGFGTAIIYKLYKPISENNLQKITELMNFYGKIYRIIGFIILIIGLLITPFIQYLIKKDVTVEMFVLNQLRVYFILFLLNSVTSYFFAYKRSLIMADQKKYITTIYRYIFFILLNIAQIIGLYLSHNFILFLILQIIFTLLENIILSFKADRMYPFLKEYKDYYLLKEEKKSIYKYVKAMMMHKIGGVTITGSTSIIISAFIGLIATGLYSNYLLVITAINTIIGQIFESFTASVGNLYAETNGENTYGVFKIIFFLNAWIIGFCSIALLILFNHFITLWLGFDLIFNTNIVLIIVINFFMNGLRKSVLMFRDAMGLFWYDRYKPLIEAVMGISFSIGFSYLWGIFGVLFGFTLATFLACFYVEPHILYKYGFKKPIKIFFLKYLIYMSIIIFSFFITYYICSFFKEITWLNLIFKGLICLIIPNTIFLIFSFKTKEFRFIFDKIKMIIKAIKNKVIKTIN